MKRIAFTLTLVIPEGSAVAPGFAKGFAFAGTWAR
jgi:hypothetical protein